MQITISSVQIIIMFLMFRLVEFIQPQMKVQKRTNNPDNPLNASGILKLFDQHHDKTDRKPLVQPTTQG